MQVVVDLCYLMKFMMFFIPLHDKLSRPAASQGGAGLLGSEG
jgi:hypothetical protein